MTPDINSYADAVADAAVVADAAERAALAENAVERVSVGAGHDLILVRHREGDRVVQQVIDTDDHASNPRRKTGTVDLHTIPSFIRYVGKHKESRTEVWVDQRSHRFVAVLDDHGAGQDDDEYALAGWGDHRARCDLKLTKDFAAWLAQDGKLLTQAQFAEHIEQMLHTIVDPPAADLFEIAQTLQGARNASFRSGQRLHDGQVSFRYEEEVQGRAGQTGQLEIPQVFVIRVELFEGTEPVQLQASFRWRLNDGHVSLGYRLMQVDQAMRAVIDQGIDEVEEALELRVLLGTPRPEAAHGGLR